MKSVHRYLLGIVIASVSLLESELAIAEPVRVDEAFVVASSLATSPTLRAARHDAAAAEYDATRAQLARLPDLTFSARYTRLSSIPERYRTLNIDPSGQSPAIVLPQLLDSFNVRASLTVGLLDPFLRLAAAADAAGEVSAARRLETEAAAAKVVFEARSAYFVLRRAHLAREIADDARRNAEEQERLESERVASGTSSISRTLGFSALVYAARTRCAAAEADVTSAEAALRAYLRRDDADRPIDLVDGGDLPRRPERSASEAPTQRSPSLRALARLGDAARAKQREEAWALLPRVSVFATADMSAPSPRAFGASTLQAVPTWEIGALLEVPLTTIVTQIAARASSAESREAAMARVDEAMRAFHAQWNGARALREGAIRRLALATDALAASRKLALARRGELAAGIVIPLDVMNAESELLRARNEVADAELDLRLADARLDLLEGRFARALP